MDFRTSKQRPGVALGTVVARCAGSENRCEAGLAELQVAAIGPGESPALGEGKLSKPADTVVGAAKKVTHWIRPPSGKVHHPLGWPRFPGCSPDIGWPGR